MLHIDQNNEIILPAKVHIMAINAVWQNKEGQCCVMTSDHSESFVLGQPFDDVKKALEAFPLDFYLVNTGLLVNVNTVQAIVPYFGRGENGSCHLIEFSVVSAQKAIVAQVPDFDEFSRLVRATNNRDVASRRKKMTAQIA